MSLNFQVFGCLPLDWLSYGNYARSLIGHFACDVIFTTTLLKVSTMLLCSSLRRKAFCEGFLRREAFWEGFRHYVMALSE